MAMLNNQMVRSLFFFKQALWDAQHMRKGWWKGERKDWTKCPKVPVIEENVVCGCLISGLFWSPKVVSIIICCFGLTFASELIKHEYHDQSCPTTTHILPDKKNNDRHENCNLLDSFWGWPIAIPIISRSLQRSAIRPDNLHPPPMVSVSRGGLWALAG